MRAVGIHLRITNTFMQTMQWAVLNKLTAVQCFLLHQDTGTYLKLNKKEVKWCSDLHSQFPQVKRFIHGSYWINLARKETEENLYVLKKELAMTANLGFQYFVLHPGFAADFESVEQGIDRVVRILNKIGKKGTLPSIVLENISYDGKGIGGSIEHLHLIQQKLDFPEKIFFCIDTAHAFCYGYPLHDSKGILNFIKLLDDTIGIDRVALIHLNDTKESFGLKKDKHNMPGDGNIGADHLKKFVLDDKVRDIPIIMELPAVSLQEQQAILDTVIGWHSD